MAISCLLFFLNVFDSCEALRCAYTVTGTNGTGIPVPVCDRPVYRYSEALFGCFKTDLRNSGLISKRFSRYIYVQEYVFLAFSLFIQEGRWVDYKLLFGIVLWRWRLQNMLSQESQKMCFECSVAIKCEILKNFKIQTFKIYKLKLNFKLLNV